MKAGIFTAGLKKICLTVTNDLNYDQRMIRICTSLAAAGYEVEFIGRKRRSSEPLTDREFKQTRLNCWFDKGKFFYAEFNIRLLLVLLFKRFDVLCSIDLDTIIPGYLATWLRRKPYVHDAHEYFTELEEVVSRPFVRRTWKWIESWILPRVKYGYTINDTYAELYKNDYGIDLEVVRNAAVLDLAQENSSSPEHYILYQGAIGDGRGLREMILAMKHIDMTLKICGSGYYMKKIKELVEREKLQDKVELLGYVHPPELKEITRKAFVGLNLWTRQGRSNYYSLSNRFFDYMHAGVPQLCMDFPEYKQINDEFEIAWLI
ncbi:MAG: glycosyltransferase, partial [Bacteroidetes bacterium]|nr:glycosyltransferase [Bacteroidota bacterium]